jgi:hypothetical protein
MTKIFGNGPTNSGRCRLQPGAELVISQDQAATYTEVWVGPFATLVNDLPACKTPHPIFTTLSLDTKKTVLGKLGRGTATLVYKGVDPALGTDATGTPIMPEIDLEIDTDVEEAPIATHPNFSALVSAAGIGKSKAWFDPTSGKFEGFGPESGGGLAGVESYLVPRTVKTKYYYSSAQSTLPVGVMTGDGFRASMKSVRQGSVWKNTEVLRQVDANPLIYG